jgi:hypothetical protein
MQLYCKYAFPTRDAVFSVWSVQSGYKEEFNWEELPACQDMNLGAEELNKIESSELAVAE